MFETTYLLICILHGKILNHVIGVVREYILKYFPGIQQDVKNNQTTQPLPTRFPHKNKLGKSWVN